MAIENLIHKQEELMAAVPHTLRPEVVPSMSMAIIVVEKLMLYLTSLGHKPWRPNPLSTEEQMHRLEDFLTASRGMKHVRDAQHPLLTDLAQRRMISAFGIIEESAEYLDSVASKNEGDQLEELSDMLFFWMEQLIMSGFTWEQIEKEYARKWAVNMERYRKGKENDFSWDKRHEGKL